VLAHEWRSRTRGAGGACVPNIIVIVVRHTRNRFANRPQIAHGEQCHLVSFFKVDLLLLAGKIDLLFYFYIVYF